MVRFVVTLSGVPVVAAFQTVSQIISICEKYVARHHVLYQEKVPVLCNRHKKQMTGHGKSRRGKKECLKYASPYISTAVKKSAVKIWMCSWK